MAVIKNTLVEQIVYWILNILSPSINAQAIITYILAHKSKFCKFLIDIDFTVFKPIGDKTIGINWIILIFHIIILLVLLITIDTGLLKLSSLFSSHPSPLDENVLDNDVRAERHRVLNLHPLTTNDPVNIENNEDGQETDHLTVHDLVKRYRGRDANAVNHLTFGAKRGEAFGLLGYNVSDRHIFQIELIIYSNRVLVKQQHFVYLWVMKRQHLVQLISMDKT
jgi:hypothetical protein